jgi:hypothetical protein
MVTPEARTGKGGPAAAGYNVPPMRRNARPLVNVLPALSMLLCFAACVLYWGVTSLLALRFLPRVARRRRREGRGR